MKKMLLALMFVVLSITVVHAQPDSTIREFAAVDDGAGKLSLREACNYWGPVGTTDFLYVFDMKTGLRNIIFHCMRTIWGENAVLCNYLFYGYNNKKYIVIVNEFSYYIDRIGDEPRPFDITGFNTNSYAENWICSERNKNFLIMVRYNGLFFSTDTSETFNSDCTSRQMMPLQLNPWTDSTLWCMKDSHLCVTHDTGLTSTTVNTPITITKNTRLVFDKDQSTIYLTNAGAVGTNIYKSTNSGLTWDTVPQTMGGLITTGWQPGMLVKISNGAVYTSYNHGATFIKDTTIPVTGWQTLTSTPLHDTVILVRNSLIYTYSAHGLSWLSAPVSVNERAKENNALMLTQNYPNPATTTTTISYELPEQSKVTLKLYNLLGEEVKTILDCSLQPQGKYQEEVNVAKLPNGVYIYVLEVNGKRESKKMIKLN